MIIFFYDDVCFILDQHACWIFIVPIDHFWVDQTRTGIHDLQHFRWAH